MKVRERDVREVDGLEDTRVSVEIADLLCPPPEGFGVRLNVNDNCWPHQSATLTPAAARAAARHLLEFADEAELLNLEAADVEMACTTCGQGVRKSFGSPAWQHREPGAAPACTAAGPLKARVAAG